MPDTIIIENQETANTTADVAEVVADAVENAVTEIQEEINEANEIEQLKAIVQSHSGFLESINGKLDTLLNNTSVVEDVVQQTLVRVDDVQTELTEAILDSEAEVETGEDLAETIAQLDNDIEVDNEMVTETLDTNSVIDLIAPEVKKEKRRLIFL
jgi:hypothetical protein